MSAINAGEVYYFLRKYHSALLAESRESSPTLPGTIEAPTVEKIWGAAFLKGRNNSWQVPSFVARSYRGLGGTTAERIIENALT